MKFEKSCGAIVFRKFHGNTELLLVKHVGGGHWSFPKGHVETNETEVETAIREIMEETGLDVIIDTSFRKTVTYSPKKDTQKEVVYFIAKAKTYEYTAQEEEISEIRWVELTHAIQMLSYDNDKQLVMQAKPILQAGF